ncbi:hypothetical protein CXG81DRAFT_27028 [Caulochytrium protostelioides]|uniref:Uncharacterized protein n=1 Tax=Caulochytrium protostelioides TaxID=1555241 RepID=A0A4P9X5I0_9FUNG|nr:hypothetical protein CXG81DRAFT_27028 [Caulochytrium protostelioides]|eukprot:RKP00270.1 hypothetical protein CXG81DRAFT_27028 [Caulochytrium protostelioides]
MYRVHRWLALAAVCLAAVQARPQPAAPSSATADAQSPVSAAHLKILDIKAWNIDQHFLDNTISIYLPTTDVKVSSVETPDGAKACNSKLLPDKSDMSQYKAVTTQLQTGTDAAKAQRLTICVLDKDVTLDREMNTVKRFLSKVPPFLLESLSAIIVSDFSPTKEQPMLYRVDNTTMVMHRSQPGRLASWLMALVHRWVLPQSDAGKIDWSRFAQAVASDSIRLDTNRFAVAHANVASYFAAMSAYVILAVYQPEAWHPFWLHRYANQVKFVADAMKLDWTVDAMYPASIRSAPDGRIAVVGSEAAPMNPSASVTVLEPVCPGGRLRFHYRPAGCALYGSVSNVDYKDATLRLDHARPDVNHPSKYTATLLYRMKMDTSPEALCDHRFGDVAVPAEMKADSQLLLTIDSKSPAKFSIPWWPQGFCKGSSKAINSRAIDSKAASADAL